MFSPIQKQLLINQIGNNLNISNDIINIIKSFCFYDIKTYNLIQIVKYNREQINHIIKKVLLFYNFKHRYNNRNHHWGVIMYTLENSNYIHFNNDNCRKCGEYVNDIYNTHLLGKIKCKCQNT